MDNSTGTADSLMEKTTNDVVVSIVAAEAAISSSNGSGALQHNLKNSQVGFTIKSPDKAPSGSRLSPRRPEALSLGTRLPSEISKLSPAATATSSNNPLLSSSQAVTRRLSRGRSSFLRAKSRLVEPPYPTDVRLVEDGTQPVAGAAGSPTKAPTRVSASTSKSIPMTPKTPLITAGQGGDSDDDEEEEEVYKATLQKNPKKGKKWNWSTILEWSMFVVLTAFLAASLTVHKLIQFKLWSLELWKWSVLAMVMFCGRLINEWGTNAVVCLIERNFLLKKKVLYFVYGVKRSVQVFLWLACILLAWSLLFTHGVKRSRKTKKILHYITMALAGFVVGAAIWLLKNLFIKTVAVKFHVNRFFDRIQESLFHQYVLQVLSGPPLLEMAERVGSDTAASSGKLSFKGRKAKKAKEEVVDVDRLKTTTQEKVSAWTMRGLIKVITGTQLSTISNSIGDGDDVDDDGGEQISKEITSEWEAKSAAYQIFKNVAKPGCKYIEEEDLLRFMKKEEVDHVFPLFEGATEGSKIKKAALTKWVVNVYLERKFLAHSLDDTKTAVEELNKIASAIVLILNIVIWNLMMEFLTTKILLFISSQMLLVVFMFGNTAKMMFEAIIFVFIMHPFDVGDRCVIDGVQMVVDEMNILTTIFLKYDNEKIIYPNSVLATKPISNFYRSPEMSDSVEFAVDFSTSVETLGDLKARIKVYIEGKPQHWRPSFSLQVKDIEDMNKMKMGLYVNHTINFQNAGERNSRRCDLLMELKKIFEDLGIKYHLLPQQVHVAYVGSPNACSSLNGASGVA